MIAPFFNIGFNLAILHSSAKDDRFIDEFIIFLKRISNNLAQSFGNIAGTWSIPVTLLVLRLSKIFLIISSGTSDNSRSLDMLHKFLA